MKSSHTHFTTQQLIDFVSNNERMVTVTCTPDGKYALYKFDRGDRFEIRMEETFYREKQHTIGYMETILRFFLPKNESMFGILHTMLRNCLLVERIK